MAARNERDLLELASKRGESLAAWSSSSHQQWEHLRLAFEGLDSIGRRGATAQALRYWRSLPYAEKGINVRFLSAVWNYYFLESNQSTKLDKVALSLKDLGDRLGLIALRAEGLTAEGLHLLTQGKASDAIKVLELGRALFISTKQNDFDAVRSSILLASAFRLAGDRASAVSILQRARELCLELEEIPLLASISQTLGMNYLETGDLESAWRCFEFARDSSQYLSSKKRELRANLGLAMTQLRRGDYAEASVLAKASLQMAEVFQLPREICLAHEFLGQ